MARIAYRPEIDGLRAVAILPVILFHAGFDAFAGGFVGVDVFFVISGYLITAIILADQEAGRFHLLDFYERRVRRILPALLLMLLCVTPVAVLTLSPYPLRSYGEGVGAALLFLSNVYLWRSINYFEPAAADDPLLHMWSLAVEEQFYLAFPLAALLFGAARWRWFLAVIALAAVLSFGAAQILSDVSATATFYLTPTRAWELLVGAFCAVLLRKTRLPRRSDALASLGLGAIIASVAFYDAATPFPSVYTLAPVLGAAAVILFAERGTATARLLSIGPLVGVGLISYSAYLWHQPIFAFYRLWTLEEPTLGAGVLLIGAILAVAALSWRFVETPFRRSARVSRRALGASVLGGYALTVAAAVVFVRTEGFLDRLSPPEAALFAAHAYPRGEAARQGTCFLLRADRSEVAPECVASATGPRAALIWGDSFAAALQHGVATETAARGWRMAQITAAECPPVFDFPWRGRANCVDVNAGARAAIDRFEGVVLLHADWRRYARTARNRAALIAGLRRTVEALRAADKRFVVLLSGPQWSRSLPNHLLRHRAADRVAAGETVTAATPLLPELIALDRAIVDGAGLELGEFRSIAAAFCDPRRQLCRVGARDADGGWDLDIWDYGHVTRRGAERVMSALGPRLFGPHLDGSAE